MIRKRLHLLPSFLLATVIGIVLTIVPSLALASGGSYIGQFNTISTVASTVPHNGDVNPYGVAVIPRTVGNLTQGNILVSNFNNSQNLQGTGTTIVQIAPNGTVSLFAQLDPNHLPGRCPGGVGLTTALSVLSQGWVFVGSLPTSDGTSKTAKAGCIIVLDSHGKPVETFSNTLINGPWDMTAFECNHNADCGHADGGNNAFLFVTNVLNGTVHGNGHVVHKGTVIRIALQLPNHGATSPQDNNFPQIQDIKVIGSRFAERTDPMALVIGPTGVALSGSTLYVADSLNNRIASIPDALNRDSSAGTGQTVTTGGMLNDPLGLTVAPNGDILTVNGNDGYVIETNSQGTQIDHKLLDNTGSPPGAGCLFGLAIVPGGHGLYFVDDCDNTLKVLH